MDRKIETWKDFRNETDSGRHLIGGVRGCDRKVSGPKPSTASCVWKPSTVLSFCSPNGGNSMTHSQPVFGAEGAKKHT